MNSPQIKAQSSPEKPWSRLTLIVVLLIALATIFNVAQDSDIFNAMAKQERIGVEWILAIIWFVIGVWLIGHVRRIIIGLATKKGKSDVRVAQLISRIFSAVGYSFVLVVSLHLLHINVGSILVGGAVTGVIVGIGAQSTLSNLFAAIVLFTIRPFYVGQTILIRTYLYGGIEYTGTVLDVNWYYTVLIDGGQRRVLPNSSVIISAITIVSDSGMQLYTVPLPYTVAVHEFEAELEQVTKGQARVSVKEFGEQTYTVQVKLPLGADLDLLREAIWKQRT